MYDPERIAEAFELMGSTFLMDMHDVSSALFFWRKSVQIRHEGAFRQYPKKVSGKHPVLDVQEFDSHEELEVIMDNSHALKMQVKVYCMIEVRLGKKNLDFCSKQLNNRQWTCDYM